MSETVSGRVPGNCISACRSALLLGVPLLALAMLGGCALYGSNEGVSPENAPARAAPERIGSQPVPASRDRQERAINRLILTDLIEVLTQLRPPISTTVQVQNDIDTDPLGLSTLVLLGERGYGIQGVDADQGANLLHYEKTITARPGNNAQIALQLQVGELVLSRSYDVDGGLVTPATPMDLAGTRQPVVLDDRKFGVAAVGNAAVSQVRYTSADPLDTSIPVIALITPDVVQGATRAATGEPSSRALNSARVEIQNLYYGDTSAFGGIVEDYRQIDRQVVVFGDDSMRLRDTGKQQIRALVERYDEQRDLFSLVGCSNGPTRLDIGNQGLALGRSERVAEELMTLGVARERILDEGCWAPVSAGNRFPGRGVVVELLRKGG